MTTFRKPVHTGSVARYEITTKRLKDKTDEISDAPPTLEFEDAAGTNVMTASSSSLEGGTTSDYFIEIEMLESWGIGEFRGIWKWQKGGRNFKRAFTFIVDEPKNI